MNKACVRLAALDKWCSPDLGGRDGGDVAALGEAQEAVDGGMAPEEPLEAVCLCFCVSVLFCVSDVFPTHAGHCSRAAPKGARANRTEKTSAGTCGRELLDVREAFVQARVAPPAPLVVGAARGPLQVLLAGKVSLMCFVVCVSLLLFACTLFIIDCVCSSPGKLFGWFSVLVS